MNLIYSVPHTGTRFTMAFLDFIGVSYIQRHSTEEIDDRYTKIIVPMRDPAINFLSLRKNNERRPFQELLDQCCNDWELLGKGLEGRHRILFKIDGAVDFQNIDYSPLVKVAKYFDKRRALPKLVKFGWPVVGAYKFPPTSINSFRSVSDNERDVIFQALEKVRRVYGYHNNNPN